MLIRSSPIHLSVAESRFFLHFTLYLCLKNVNAVAIQHNIITQFGYVFECVCVYFSHICLHSYCGIECLLVVFTHICGQDIEKYEMHKRMVVLCIVLDLRHFYCCLSKRFIFENIFVFSCSFYFNSFVSEYSKNFEYYRS